MWSYVRPLPSRSYSRKSNAHNCFVTLGFQQSESLLSLAQGQGVTPSAFVSGQTNHEWQSPSTLVKINHQLGQWHKRSKVAEPSFSCLREKPDSCPSGVMERDGLGIRSESSLLCRWGVLWTFIKHCSSHLHLLKESVSLTGSQGPSAFNILLIYDILCLLSQTDKEKWATGKDCCIPGSTWGPCDTAIALVMWGWCMSEFTCIYSPSLHVTALSQLHTHPLVAALLSSLRETQQWAILQPKYQSSPGKFCHPPSGVRSAVLACWALSLGSGKHLNWGHLLSWQPSLSVTAWAEIGVSSCCLWRPGQRNRSNFRTEPGVSERYMQY